MEKVIETQDLTKNFGDFVAVNNISLCVNQGEIFGFLGLNGAGKTTTIRMLLGMITPTSGSAFLKGEKVSAGNYELWQNVGYLVETPCAYPDLTVRENLEIINRLRHIRDKKTVETARVNAVIEKLHLGPYREKKARYLSLGNAQRLGLAKALLHNPGILILDEPANGLDPAGIVEIRELLIDLAANHGVTIFISSHILSEITRLASRIGIIHEGRLIRELDSTRLNQLLERRLVVDTLDQNAAASTLGSHGFAGRINPRGHLEITTQLALSHPENIAALLSAAGNPPRMLKIDEENLESYFLREIGVTKK